METRQRILLCEDDESLGMLLREYLQAKGYDAELCLDGEAGYKAFMKSHFDLCVLDVMMPKKDGFAVVKEVRAKGNHIPILILTARSEIDDKVLGLDSGADDYLTKPFVIKEFLARLRALLRRNGEVKEAYHIGNISLDHETFSLTGPSGTVRLTNTEYKMMEYLIANRGSVLSTERLLENVWDYDSEVEINVVWAYISALRKKLEGVGADYNIKAMRGVGYQLTNEEKK